MTVIAAAGGLLVGAVASWLYWRGRQSGREAEVAMLSAQLKEVKAEAEKAKVSVRNARREAIEGLKKALKTGLSEDNEKDAEARVQKLHDKYLKDIDVVFAAKEKEILTV